MAHLLYKFPIGVKLVLVAITMISTSHLLSQDTIPEYNLMFSYQIEEGLAHGSIGSHTSAAYAYNLIGDYANALTSYGLSTDMDFGAPIPFYTRDLHPVSAKDYILEKAKTHDIIIVSEAHQKPQHRVFTKSLLQSLFDQGYRHFGLEALPTFNVHPMLPLDSILSNQGYPLVSKYSRGYSAEPNMANMIREAINIGYEVFGYEKDGMNQKDMERDSAQTINIMNHMSDHPDGRYLLHCGWFHAVENDQLKRRNAHWMAHNLKRMSGRDPLTIYQDMLSEELYTQESENYKNLTAAEPSIFLDKADQPFMFYEDFDFFDLLIYHPRTSYINQRPNWIYSEDSKEYFVSDLNPDFLPAVIRAIPIDDKLNAAPVDIIEVKYKYDRKPLILSPGKYKLLIKYDRGNDEIRTIEVKP